MLQAKFSLSDNRLHLICFVVWFLHGCSAMQYDGPANRLDAFIQDYETIAFAAEGSSYKSRKLMRWCDPVLVYLPPNLSSDTAQTARRTIDWLSLIDGLTVTVSKDRDNATLVLEAPKSEEERDRIVDQIFPANRSVRREMKNSTCFFEFSANPDGCITGGTVVVPTYHAQKLQNHCISEELVQVMGLPNDLSRGLESIFDNDSLIENASLRDRRIVQIHYHPFLKPGMKKSDVIRAIRPVAAKLIDH